MMLPLWSLNRNARRFCLCQLESFSLRGFFGVREVVCIFWLFYVDFFWKFLGISVSNYKLRKWKSFSTKGFSFLNSIAYSLFLIKMPASFFSSSDVLACPSSKKYGRWSWKKAAFKILSNFILFLNKHRDPVSSVWKWKPFCANTSNWSVKSKLFDFKI